MPCDDLKTKMDSSQWMPVVLPECLEKNVKNDDGIHCRFYWLGTIPFLVPPLCLRTHVEPSWAILNRDGAQAQTLPFSMKCFESCCELCVCVCFASWRWNGIWNHSKLSWQLCLTLSKSHIFFESLCVCWCLPRPQNGCVVSLITKQDTWLKKKLSVFPLQVISSAHGNLFIASLISLLPKPKPQMKPKIQAGTTQKAKEGNNMSFLRPIPTPIFDTTMLTIPWTPTREASLNYSPLWKYGCFRSIFPGLLNYQLRSHAFCHQLVFLPNRFCFSPLGRSLGPCPCPKSMCKCPQQTTWQTPLTGLPFDPWRQSSRDKFPDWPSRFQEKQRVGEKRCHHVPPSSPPPPSSSLKQKAMLTLLF